MFHYQSHKANANSMNMPVLCCIIKCFTFLNYHSKKPSYKLTIWDKNNFRKCTPLIIDQGETPSEHCHLADCCRFCVCLLPVNLRYILITISGRSCQGIYPYFHKYTVSKFALVNIQWFEVEGFIVNLIHVKYDPQVILYCGTQTITFCCCGDWTFLARYILCSYCNNWGHEYLHHAKGSDTAWCWCDNYTAGYTVAWTKYVVGDCNCLYHNNWGCEYLHHAIRRAHASCLYQAVTILLK